MKYQNFICPYELALKLHELGVNSESEFYFVKEMKGGGSQTESVTQNTMRYSYRKEGDLIPAYMSHELGEILPSMINISKSKIWDDWLQLTQYFPNKDSEYYEAAYVRYDAYNPQTEVYSGFGDTEKMTQWEDMTRILIVKLVRNWLHPPFVTPFLIRRTMSSMA